MYRVECQFDLEVCGGIYVNEPCVVDGNLVSGRTFHDHGLYMGKWMALLDAAAQRKQSQSRDQNVPLKPNAHCAPYELVELRRAYSGVSG